MRGENERCFIWKYQVPSTKYQVPSTKYQVPSTKYQVPRFELGFTLVELSIVIVIIGIIVAGIVGGQSLVKQAKLRTIINDINKYEVAHNTFFLEYNAIPGDFNNAVSYGWVGAVNGDGNRVMNIPSERLQYWLHLQKAGLISQAYSGVVEANPYPYNKIGVNIPKVSFSNDSGIATDTAAVSIYGVSNLRSVRYNVASQFQSCNGFLNGILFTAKEAYSMDKKADDGNPSSGSYMTAKGHTTGSCAQHPDCVMDPNTAPSTTYNFSNDNVSCRFFYWLKK